MFHLNLLAYMFIYNGPCIIVTLFMRSFSSYMIKSCDFQDIPKTLISFYILKIFF